jgi:hypothetical protein
LLKAEKYDFDQYEKKLLEDKTIQLMSIEFYKGMVTEFGFNNYYVKKGWNSHITLVVEIDGKELEFMFGHDRLRIHFNRTIFSIEVNDKYQDAIRKILEVLDYVEEDAKNI